MSERTVLGSELAPCGDPLTGFYRDGGWNAGAEDRAAHAICAVVTAPFPAHQRAIGNDLTTPARQYGFPGLQLGDHSCVTAANRLRAEPGPLAAPREHAVDVRADPGAFGG